MRCRSRRSRALPVAFLVVVTCSLGASAASAAVRAFDARTGAEDSAFVTLGPATRPSVLIPDGARGVYVVGRVLVGGRTVQIAHLLPDGRVDPSFHVSIGGGFVASGAVRGDKLALLGSFQSIDGTRRREIAVLDAHSGRLLGWAPAFAGAALGRGSATSSSHRIASW